MCDNISMGGWIAQFSQKIGSYHCGSYHLIIIPNWEIIICKGWVQSNSIETEFISIFLFYFPKLRHNVWNVFGNVIKPQGICSDKQHYDSLGINYFYMKMK